MYRTTKKKLVRRLGVSAVVALGVAGVGAGVASASTGHIVPKASHVFHAAHGTGASSNGSCDGDGGQHDQVVSAITSSTLSVTNADGTSTTYVLSSSTTYSEGSTTVDASAVAVGESVDVQVTSGTLDATSVNIDVPHAMGQVTAVFGDTITLSGPNGSTQTITVSDATTYSENNATAALSNVTVGVYLNVQGTLASTSSAFSATSVDISTSLPTPPANGGQPGQPGQPGQMPAPQAMGGNRH